jgi:hypothetical protein
MAILADADKMNAVQPGSAQAAGKSPGWLRRFLSGFRQNTRLAPESLCRTSALVALRAEAVRQTRHGG